MASERDRERQQFRDGLEDPKVVPIDAVFWDVRERTARLLTNDMTVAILRYTENGQLLFEALPSQILNLFAADVTERELEPSTFAKELNETAKDPTLVLSGKIKGAVKPGKLDRGGRPTAWSRFAAHLEGEREARLLLATYHGWTAEVALALESDSSITAQGYHHHSDQPNRLDSFSIIALHQWPGKSEEPSNGRQSPSTSSRQQSRRLRR